MKSTGSFWDSDRHKGFSSMGGACWFHRRDSIGRGTHGKGEELTPKRATTLGWCLREQETKSEVLENLSSGQLRF